jgi:tetratricopeptide (TPR) repeat protein
MPPSTVRHRLETLRREYRRVASSGASERSPSQMQDDLTLLRDALESDPTSADTWNALGVVSVASGRLADAEDAFRKALAIHPDHVDAASNRHHLVTMLQATRASSARAFAVMTVTPPGYVHVRALRELAESLHFGLIALGRVSQMASHAQDQRIHIVLGAHLLSAHEVPIPSDAILYNTEQVEQSKTWMTSRYLELLRSHTVWDYSRANVAALRRLGVDDIQHVPVGYVAQLTRIEAAPEDVDVVFVGSINDRRARILHELAQRGFSVKALCGVYGAERDAWLARGRIILNTHFYDGSPFEIVRVSYLLANTRFVVSESTPGDADELDLAQGVALAPYERLVETCSRYLERPEERRRIAEAGLERMRSRRMDVILQSALGGALAGNECRAASIGGVGETATHPAMLGNRGALLPEAQGDR